MREVIAGIGLLVCLFLIPSSANAMAWPYYGIGGGVGDEGWHGGYHGSWGFTGPYCGYPAEPCVPPVVTVPSMTIGSNGTMTVLQKPKTTITAPPGSVINSVSVTPLIPGVNEIDFTGTWAITNNPKSVPTHDITGIPTITFDGFMHNVCCWNHKEQQVYLQPFTAYVGHRTFKGYWEFDLSFFNRPNTLQLCADSTDVKHFVGVSPILSSCTSMTVKIVNNNHVELLNRAGDTMHLIRLEKHLCQDHKGFGQRL